MRLVDSAKAHVVRGRSFVLLRRYAEAREAVERARALGAGASVLEVAAFAAYYARDLDAALRLADEAASGSDDPEVLDACGYLAAKVLHTRGQITDAEKRLAPMAESPGRSQVAAFAGIWRSLVHLHRGHVDAAGIDLAGSDSARLARIPYAPLYVDQFTAHLAGLDGRPVEALTVAERLRAAATEQRALRFFGRAEVYRGWALSILGDPSAVDALEEAREVARSAGNPEPLGQGSLDLATVHLDHGRLEAAEAALDDVDEVIAAGGQVSNGWRIRLRAHYLRGRLALAHRDTDAAAEAAAGVIARARLDNIDRYDVLGSLLRIEATATAGEPVDVGDVEPYLPRLLAVAQPEAWRITARLGHVLGAERLLVWSSDRIAELIRRNAPYSEQIRADAARVLSSGR
jgi:tetratricopeptide (TPR) repeat protein